MFGYHPPQTRSMSSFSNPMQTSTNHPHHSHQNHQLFAPTSVPQAHHVTAPAPPVKKKRRGTIEKRRRDRINASLNELKRLVPAAFEKQNSAKLEKAEILQLTVEHLKSLHAKGVDTLAMDPQKFAMDYHSIGFRECATEVARYLVAVEGMDLQDPLRIRLLNHLQCYSHQRELTAIRTSWSPSSTSLGSTTPTAPPPPPPACVDSYSNYSNPLFSCTTSGPPTHGTMTITPTGGQTAYFSPTNPFSMPPYGSDLGMTANNNKPYRPWGSDLYSTKKELAY